MTKLEEMQRIIWDSIAGNSDELCMSINPIAKLTPLQCLIIYSRAYESRLIEALGETFEACWWVMGDKLFFELAKDYIKSFPSKNYDLSDFGDKFSEFLNHDSRKESIPFIVSLACFEWSFKDVFHSSDISSDPTLLVEALSGQRPYHLKLYPSARLLQLEHSVYEIWKQRGQPNSSVPQFSWKNPQVVALYKIKGQVHVMNFEAIEFDLIQRLLVGESLGDIAESMQEAGVQSVEKVIQNLFAKLRTCSILLPEFLS